MIDNWVEGSDAAIEIDDKGGRAGAVSTIAGAYIAQRIVLEVVNEYKKCGQPPLIFMSANVPVGDQWNKDLVQKYKSRIKFL